MRSIYETSTPRAEGFAMPAEWTPHAGCLMAWPTRAKTWDGRVAEAQRDYVAVAAAIADFEPVVMICEPGLAADVRRACPAGVTPLELPIDDAWMRDSGPTFVTHPDGRAAAVSFVFNGWGSRQECARDDAVAGAIARELGLPVFQAPIVMEGGAFFTDGAGTAFATAECLLHPNRNPTLTADEIAATLCASLGTEQLVWLPYGHHLDTGPGATDGHVDGVFQCMGPGRLFAEVASYPSPERERGLANIAALEAARDAAGSPYEIVVFPAGPHGWYANHYLANGAVIVPVDGHPTDDDAVERLAGLYPERTVVPVPGAILGLGGGGPHCITQQVPAGIAL